MGYVGKKMNITKEKDNILYDGVVFKVNQKTFKNQDTNETFTRDIVESDQVVHVLPIDDKGNVYCIDEFRGGPESVVIGFPAGKIDKGEKPEDAVSREVEEEIGMKVVELVAVTSPLYSTMGISNELGYYYIARVVEFEPGERTNFQDEGENITTRKMTAMEFGEIMLEKAKTAQPMGLKTVMLWSLYLLKDASQTMVYDRLGKQ